MKKLSPQQYPKIKHNGHTDLLKSVLFIDLWEQFLQKLLMKDPGVGDEIFS